MVKALIKFSNGDVLELSEGQSILLFSKIIIDGKTSISQSDIFKVWRHHHDALLTPILDMLCSCDFFQPIDDTHKAYSSFAVVSVENL